MKSSWSEEFVEEFILRSSFLYFSLHYEKTIIELRTERGEIERAPQRSKYLTAQYFCYQQQNRAT